jgi:hypothetical protein
MSYLSLSAKLVSEHLRILHTLNVSTGIFIVYLDFSTTVNTIICCTNVDTICYSMFMENKFLNPVIHKIMIHYEICQSKDLIMFKTN